MHEKELEKKTQARNRIKVLARKKAREMTGSDTKKSIPCWHAYHNVLAAKVNPFFRIFDILSSKPPNERKLRLRLFRVIKDEKTKEWVNKLYALTYFDSVLSDPPDFVLEAHKRECVKDCPWNEKTIFSERARISKKGNYL